MGLPKKIVRGATLRLELVRCGRCPKQHGPIGTPTGRTIEASATSNTSASAYRRVLRPPSATHQAHQPAPRPIDHQVHLLAPRPLDKTIGTLPRRRRRAPQVPNQSTTNQRRDDLRPTPSPSRRAGTGEHQQPPTRWAIPEQSKWAIPACQKQTSPRMGI